jgi:hypothetical protein
MRQHAASSWQLKVRGMSGAKIFSEFLDAGWTAYADLGTHKVTLEKGNISCGYWGATQNRDPSLILLIHDAYEQEQELLTALAQRQSLGKLT